MFLVPMESYGPLIEEKVQEILEKAYNEGKKEMSTIDINREIRKIHGMKIHFCIGHTKMTFQLWFQELWMAQ